MNYAAHYERLIARARSRSLVGYRERHHVLPRCMGGGNEKENIVELTGREHWFAHKLLIFICPENRKLVHAAVWMAKRAAGGRAYEWLRRRNAIAVGNLMRGRAKSSGHRAKISEANRRRVCSTETRVKISTANIGKVASPETRAKMSAGRMGNTYGRGGLGIPKSPEHRAKKSAALKGKPWSLARRASYENGQMRAQI